MSDKGNIPLMSGFSRQKMDGNYDYGAFPNQPNPLPPPNVHPGNNYLYQLFIINYWIGRKVIMKLQYYGFNLLFNIHCISVIDILFFSKYI